MKTPEQIQKKEQIQKWILNNCVDDYGHIDLIGLDFGDKTVILSEMKAGVIYQEEHKAYAVFQNSHEADKIFQNEHKCDHVTEGGHISINEMTLEEAEKKFNIKIVK